MDTRATLAFISTFTALIPILVGMSVLKKHNLVKWFVAFLCYGFLTDSLNAMSDESTGIIEETTFALLVQNLYSLIDSCFLFWFLAQVVEIKRIKRLFLGFSILMIPLWVLFSFTLKNTLINNQSLSSYFESGYEMLLAVCAAVVLLKLTERGRQSSNQGLLWITIGIFFINFCSFFIHSFVSMEVAQNIWFMANLINIFTLIIYAIGFWRFRSIHPDN